MIVVSGAPFSASSVTPGKWRGELATEQMAGDWRVGCRRPNFLGGFPASHLLQ
jgi:hypothetical protein